eukprot:1149791-Pelagomonas_calceolata.AAC.3
MMLTASADARSTCSRLTSLAASFIANISASRVLLCTPFVQLTMLQWLRFPGLAAGLHACRSASGRMTDRAVNLPGQSWVAFRLAPGRVLDTLVAGGQQVVQAI